MTISGPRPVGPRPVGLAATREGLAFLAPDLFVLVADALALVRFRLAHGPDLGGELSDLLLVGALDQDGALGADLDRDSIRWRFLDGVGVANRQHDRFLVGIHAGHVADAF